MATERQKRAARHNLEKARAAQGRRQGGRAPAGRSQGMSTAEKNDLDDEAFAFPSERKEPLTDAPHVRNAISRFNQVEGVSDAERDRAWKRIQSAATKFGVEMTESDWHEVGS